MALINRDSTNQKKLTVGGSAVNLKQKAFKWRRELDFFICVGLDSHRFWVFPFGDLDKLTVKSTTVIQCSGSMRARGNYWKSEIKVLDFCTPLYFNSRTSLVK